MLRTSITAACCALGLLLPIGADAQSLGDRFRSVTREAADEVERTIERNVRQVTRCALGDRSCIEQASARGDQIEILPDTPARGTEPQTYRDIVFPQGAISFADEVVSFTPGSPGPSAPHTGAFHTLGVPDWEGGSTCRMLEGCQWVSLGRGGELVVRFADNVLTGNGNADIDLWIFEVGPDVEDMAVDISTDGINWQSVGAIGGGKSGVDIDAFGLGSGSAFSYVRLTDDPLRGGQSGATVGADVDAIGAISTRAASGSTCSCLTDPS